MIAYLKGTVKLINASSIILVTSGGEVGYQIFVPARIAAKTLVGSQAEFFVHTHVREDQLSLYGLETADDLQMFELLISVSGVGPKIALNVFNVGSAKDVKKALASGDKLFFKAIVGLGEKTAAKILVELAGKIKLAKEDGSSNSQVFEEALSALENLGYEARDIYAFFRQNKDLNGESVESIVKKFLKK